MINLPTGAEIDRQFRRVEVEYKKWLLLKTGKDTREIRMNEVLVKLQGRAVILRRTEVLHRLKRVKFKAHRQVPHIQIHVPGVNV